MEALLAGTTYEDAARRAGVSERTVRRRMADATFRQELMRHQDETLGRARRRLVALVPGAVEVVRDIVDDQAAPAAARLRACEVILARGDPLPQRLKATVAVAPRPGDVSPKEVLADALDRARIRPGLEEPVLSSNGNSNARQ
jgi:hypothetical protein